MELTLTLLDAEAISCPAATMPRTWIPMRLYLAFQAIYQPKFAIRWTFLTKNEPHLAG